MLSILLAWFMIGMESGMTECLMAPGDWFILMEVCILGPLSRGFQVVRADLSAHKDGIMRDS